jgi:hypothetical protein
VIAKGQVVSRTPFSALINIEHAFASDIGLCVLPFCVLMIDLIDGFGCSGLRLDHFRGDG